MKAIRVLDFGGPEVLRLQDVPDLIPHDGEIVVRVKAIGVNPVDTYIRAGKYAALPTPPYTPGSDAAGIVEAIGAGVIEYSIGDRVYADHTVKNGYAEQVVGKATQFHALPESISFAQGAALGVPYATAHRALFDKGNAKAGDYVMIHGASGGVGTAAVQWALLHKLKVIATAGTREGCARLEKMGVPYVLNHSEAHYMDDAHGATCGHGVDVIIEMLANKNLGADLKILAKKGRVVVVGSRGEVTIDPRDLMGRETAIFGMTLSMASPEELAQTHHEIVEGLQNGALVPVIGEEIPLSEAPRAHEAVMKSGANGKIVLVP